MVLIMEKEKGFQLVWFGRGGVGVGVDLANPKRGGI